MEIVAFTTIVALLFLLVGLCEPLAERMRLPFSVILAAAGILIGVGSAVFLTVDFANSLNFIARSFTDLPIRANSFLYIFLPTLLFQVTLGMEVRRILDDWVPIVLLAVVAVVLSTVMIGGSLSWLGIVPMTTGLLIGAVVSTTDPSAVAGIFRSLSAPKRLGRIIEGESLLNDAAAIAIFGLIISYVMAGPDPDTSDALGQFPYLVAGGAGVGVAMAWIGLKILVGLNRFPLAQISVSVSIPYLTYIITERAMSASGVIAVVVCGLVLTFSAPGRIDPMRWAKLRELWDILAHWAGALIFVLAAILIPKLMASATLIDIVYIGVVAIAAFAARAVVLFLLLPALTLVRLSPRVETPYKAAILWGGLRGAVTLALALAVTENYAVDPGTKRAAGILATGFTLFTLLVQGTTLRMVITKLHLDKLTPLDLALSKQVVAVALQSVRERVAGASEDYDLTKEIVRAEAKDFGERLGVAVTEAEREEGVSDRDRVTLGLIALAGHEKDLIDQGFASGLMSSKTYEQARTVAERLLETTRSGGPSGGRSGYRVGYRRALGFGRGFRLAVALDNRLRISWPLAVLTADRFEFLLAQRLVIKGLDEFIDTRIRRIHRRRVADLLHELVARRIEAVEQALEALKLQYPGYAEELERKFLRRMGLRLERQETDDLRREGLIGPELHQALTQGIEARISRERKRPKLDLALRRAELARQVPLFSQVDEATLKRLSKGFVTRYANAGEVIRRRKDSPHSVYFIASGAVEVTTAKQTNRLGRGDMFGQISLLAGRAYQGEVKAIAPTTLLVLDEARFMNILRAKKQVREKVLKMAQERGLNEAGLKKLIEALETKPVGKPSPAQQEAAAKPALPPSATAAATGVATGTPAPLADAATPAVPEVSAAAKEDAALSPDASSADKAEATKQAQAPSPQEAVTADAQAVAETTPQEETPPKAKPSGPLGDP